MSNYLFLFILLPLVAFLLSLVLPKRAEKLIAAIAMGATGLHALAAIGFTAFWIYNGHETLDIKQLSVYKAHGFEFFFDFYFDKITATFAIVGSLLAFLVCTFSKSYMHRESGFKRYFSTLLLFFIGYNLIVFAGNFETMFTGWEIIGLCSFLLISFYRDRYLPVRNALKVLSLFRLSDICLIVAMWLCHHLFHANITFHQLHTIAAAHSGEMMFIAIGIFVVLAAIVKSAQFPFTYWLPRAMEGPTTSSAIFYGSLSVHIGAFVLLRTYPLWENIVWMKFVIAAIGVITAIVATGIAKVQPTVKTQIAYASAAQIGIIFAEIAFGLEWLALFHFGANAFLRTYQLLVSPSVMNYMIHDQFFTQEKVTLPPVNKLRNTFYVLGIKEWNTDAALRKLVWSPFKWIGSLFRSESPWPFVITSVVAIGAGILPQFSAGVYPEVAGKFLPEVFSGLAVIFVLVGFASRGDALRAWMISSTGFILLLIAFMQNENSVNADFYIYAAGILPAIVIGAVCLMTIKSIDGNIELNRYHGYSYEKPVTTLLFLISGLALIGFPITSAFVGLDVLLAGVAHDRVIVLVFAAIVIAFAELTAIRIYARVFLGQHKKQDHPVAFKAS